MKRIGWLVLALAVLLVAVACAAPNEPQMVCRPGPFGETCKPITRCTWQAVAGVVRDNAGRDMRDTIPVWYCWPKQ